MEWSIFIPENKLSQRGREGATASGLRNSSSFRTPSRTRAPGLEGSRVAVKLYHLHVRPETRRSGRSVGQSVGRWAKMCVGMKDGYQASGEGGRIWCVVSWRLCPTRPETLCQGQGHPGKGGRGGGLFFLRGGHLKKGGREGRDMSRCLSSSDRW